MASSRPGIENRLALEIRAVLHRENSKQVSEFPQLSAACLRRRIWELRIHLTHLSSQFIHLLLQVGPRFPASCEFHPTPSLWKQVSLSLGRKWKTSTHNQKIRPRL